MKTPHTHSQAHMNFWARVSLGCLLIIMLFAATSASAQATTAQLAGTWQVDYTLTKGSMSPDGLTYLNGLPATEKAALEPSYANRTVTFASNGNFAILLPNGGSVNGTWSLSSDGYDITATLPNGQQQVYHVAYANSNALGLQLGASSLLYPELHLTKP